MQTKNEGKTVQIILKAVITIFLSYGILLVWTHEIDIQKWATSPFKKLFHLNKKVETPIFQSGVINLMTRYKEGLKLGEVTWKNDYQECRFSFDNITKNTEVTNFKIDIQLPAGVVNFEIYQAYGLDDLNIYTDNENLKIGNNEQINEIVTTYSNHLHINASKIFPQSHLTVKLIIKPTLAHNNGFIKYNYDYLNEKGNKIVNNFVYLMPFTIKDGFVLFSINEHHVVGKYDYNTQMIPERPIVFKQNGNVEIAQEVKKENGE